MKSPEGQKCLDQFVTLIAEWSAQSMPPELLQALIAEKNHATLKELWPDIVNAYFKALSDLQALQRARPPQPEPESKMSEQSHFDPQPPQNESDVPISEPPAAEPRPSFTEPVESDNLDHSVAN